MDRSFIVIGLAVVALVLASLMGASLFQSLTLPFQANQESDQSLLDITNDGAGTAISAQNSVTQTQGILGGIEYGVEGFISTTSAGDVGVYGHAGVSSGLAPGLNAGVWGDSNRGFGVIGTSENIGVFGRSERGTAIDSFSATGNALLLNTRTGNFIVANSLSESNTPTRRFSVSNTGDVFASGQINASGADLADLLPALPSASPGDVLIVNEDGLLAPSESSYQTSVVGVYSTEPGFIGSKGDAGDLAPLALAGIVPVKVTEENGAIQPGDLLVAASMPGHAMRAGDNAPQGSVIGKALETFEGHTGLIQMLVMLR